MLTGFIRGRTADSFLSSLRRRLTKLKDLVKFGQQEFAMTKTQAAEIQTKWKQLVDPPACEHVTQEMETSNGHYLTGRYHCLVCGEPVDHP
jgi:hypothetical protein